MTATARRALIVGLLSLIALIGVAGEASAHAQLEGSDPAGGDVLTAAPAAVTLVFGEAVDLAGGSLQVFDDHLQRVDRDDLAAADEQGNRIRVGLRPGLGAGTYTVSWRVSSADTHPVSGTFTFSVGAPSAVSGAPPGTGGGGLAEGLLAVARQLGYAGLVLGPGALLVLLALWPDGLADRRIRRLLAAGTGALLTATFCGMLLEGIWASGLPLSAAWSTPGLLDTHSRRFDVLFALRSYLVVTFGALTAAAVLDTSRSATRGGRGRRRPAAPAPGIRHRRLLSGTAAAVALGLLLTWSLAGHAATGPQSPLAVLADTGHLTAVAVWFGGLVVLVAGLTPAGRAAELAVVAPRFSLLAQGAVGMLVVTGCYRAWREVGSVGALTGTTFGRLLLAKLAAVAVLVGLGDLARRWVLRHTAPVRRSLLAPRLVAHAAGPDLAVPATARADAPPPAAVRILRRGLVAELVIAACVLALTAVLVATVPARQAYVPAVQRTVQAAGLTVDLRVDAPRVGNTVVHLDVHRPDGTPVPVQQLTGSLTLPATALGPLPVHVLPAGPDPARPEADLTFPAAGDWTLQFTVQTSPLDATSLTVTVPVT